MKLYTPSEVIQMHQAGLLSDKEAMDLTHHYWSRMSQPAHTIQHSISLREDFERWYLQR